MPPALAILATGLSKSYGAHPALRSVDLEVHAGEIFGFLGPNGAGKTTTIRCMLDLIRPSAGQIRVLGLDPRIESAAVRQRTGYLPGELHLDESLTAEGMLGFLSRLRPGKPDRKRVRELADRLELDLRIPIGNLSRGNKQKVGLIQAISHQPELLLLDEPTSGLDPLIQQTALSMLQEAHHAGTTIFLSSHNLFEVEAIADRVGIIRRGRIIEVLETESLRQRSFHRAHVRLRVEADTSVLERVPGVRRISPSDGLRGVFQVEGDVDAFLRALAQLPVADLEFEHPSLEEVFLAYYSGPEGEGG